MKKQKSFTLIELLVVIAIIGLLASIVFVSLKGSRERARIAKGLSFAGQIHHALGAYAAGVWDFNKGSGTTAKDRSGNGNDGTIHGADWTSDTPNNALENALYFNGSGNYVDCGNNASLDITDAITIEAWVNIYGWSGRAEHIAYKTNAYMVRYYDDDNIRGYVTTMTEGQKNIFGDTKIPLNKWHHIALTYNGQEIKLFLNGKEDVDSVATTGEIVVNSNDLLIGYDGYNGLIDDVRIYKEALSLAQIKKLYVQGLERHISMNNEQ